MPHRFRSSMRLSPASREAVMVPESQPRDDTGPMSLTATSKATIQERLATIERAVFSSLPAQSDDVRRHEARREAHKLAGSLDVFGLTRAADLAGELERFFQTDDDRTGRGRKLMVGLRREIEQALSAARSPRWTSRPRRFNRLPIPPRASLSPKTTTSWQG